MSDVVVNSGSAEQVALDLYRVTVGLLPKGEIDNIHALMAHYSRCLKVVKGQ